MRRPLRNPPSVQMQQRALPQQQPAPQAPAPTHQPGEAPAACFPCARAKLQGEGPRPRQLMGPVQEGSPATPGPPRSGWDSPGRSSARCLASSGRGPDRCGSRCRPALRCRCRALEELKGPVQCRRSLCWPTQAVCLTRWSVRQGRRAPAAQQREATPEPVLRRRQGVRTVERQCHLASAPPQVHGRGRWNRPPTTPPGPSPRRRAERNGDEGTRSQRAGF